MADRHGAAAPLPHIEKLDAREIQRRIKAMTEAARAGGFECGAIRMTRAGDLELVDKSLVDVKPHETDKTDDYI